MLGFVAFGTLAAVTAALVIAILLPAACGGDTADEMRATMTDDGCTYMGDETLSTGMFTVEVENRTEYFGAFALAGIAEGFTVEDDLEPLLAEARQQFEQNGTLPALPPFYEQVVRGAAQAGETTFLDVDVPAGTYALMCFVDDLPTWRVYAAAQLDVAA
jgi:hypothetical protein